MKKIITYITIFAFSFSIMTAKPQSKSDIKKVEAKKQKTEKVKLSKQVKKNKEAVELKSDNESKIQKINKAKKRNKEQQNSIENKPKRLKRDRHPEFIKAVQKLEKDYSYDKESIQIKFRDEMKLLKKQKHDEIQMLKDEYKSKKKELKTKFKKNGEK